MIGSFYIKNEPIMIEAVPLGRVESLWIFGQRKTAFLLFLSYQPVRPTNLKISN